MHTPKKIGKYVIDSLVGQGAMGAVFKAYDQDIDRVVAIKILHSHLINKDSNIDLKQRFNNEIKAAARCFHQNIVTVFDCGFSDGTPYMVMEYVKGIDLRLMLKSSQSITVAQSIDIIQKVLSALQFTHQSGVVHRDIKPANIMLLDNGQVKVTDFGIAHIDTSDLTQVGDVMGTLCYMAPEARNGKKVDGRSDIFSVALVLLELLTGNRATAQHLDEVTVHNLLTDVIENQEQIQKITAVLFQAFNKNPDQRYQQAIDFSIALTNCFNTVKPSYQIENSLAETVVYVRDNVIGPQTNTHNKLNPSRTSHSSVHSGQLSILEKNLSKFLGPVAKVLVKKHAKTTENVDQLTDTLATQIPSESERKQFIKQLTSSGIYKLNQTNINSQISQFTNTTNTTYSISLSAEEVTQLTADLSLYLGPMAKLIVMNTIKKAVTLDDLYQLLSKKIPNESERKDFLKICSAYRFSHFFQN